MSRIRHRGIKRITGQEGGSLVDRHEVEKLLLITGALEVGIVDALDEKHGLSAAAVAEELGGDERACRVVLDALASLDLVDVWSASSGEPTYTLSTYGDEHLVASEVMEEVVDRVTDYARPVPVQTMLDVGGAVGHMALRFADQGMDATLVDRADVIPVAREHLGEKAEMIACVAADFTEELPVGPFGVAYLGNVCHIYGPDTNRKLLQRVHSVLAPGGTVAVRDFVWERSERAPMFAVNMLQATEEGGVWREEQYRGWLEEAGFGRVEVQDLEYSENQLVLGKRQGAR